MTVGTGFREIRKDGIAALQEDSLQPQAWDGKGKEQLVGFGKSGH